MNTIYEKIYGKNLREVINKQFEINGYDKTYDDVTHGKEDTDKEKWFQKYTTTPEKEEEFKDWLRVYLKPFVYATRIDKEIGHLLLDFGLKTINE